MYYTIYGLADNRWTASNNRLTIFNGKFNKTFNSKNI